MSSSQEPVHRKIKFSYALTTWLIICSCALAIICFRFVGWKHVESRFANRNIIQELGFTGYLANEVTATLVTWYEESTLAFQDNSRYRNFLRDIHAANGEIESPPQSHQQKNIIFIQMESVDTLSVEATFKGQPIMPFLNDLLSHSTYLANTIDNTSSGRTTDGEFLALASLPPITRKPVYRNYNLSKIASLPRILNDAGYYSFSIHGYKGSFWNRENAHSQLGYQDSFFDDSLDTSELIGWGVSDKSILKQAAEKITNAENPTFAHIVLLTNHHPYQHVAEHQGNPTGNIVEDHITSLRYVDEAIASFFRQLDENEVLENSIIAIYSDHDSSIAKELIKVVELDRNLADLDTIPLMIHGLERSPSFIEKISGLQDLPVIILKELGIPRPTTFSGNAIDSTLPTLSQFGRLVHLEGGKAVRAPSSIDASTLTKLALLNPEQLEHAQ